MPLSFETLNHGNIAFGFFNIESDMLLLDNYFFFADQFCEWMIDLSKEEYPPARPFSRHAFHISSPAKIGDLMKAIHGIAYEGFIGSIYSLYPFPVDPKNFKQNPDGDKTQDIVREKIRDFSVGVDLVFTVHDDNRLSIGPYLFDREGFHALIEYVWLGGYPRWKNDQAPSYVADMLEKVKSGRHPLFQSLHL